MDNVESRASFLVRDDELDLLDVIFQLWRGRLIIVIAIVIALVAGTTWIAIAKKHWVSTAIVTQPDAGQVSYFSGILNRLYPQTDALTQEYRAQDFTQVASLQQQLFSNFSASVDMMKEPTSQRQYTLDVSTSRLDKTLAYPLSITLRADSAVDAQAQLATYLRTLNDVLVKDYIADINGNIAIRIQELNQSLETQKKIALERNQQHLEAVKQALKIAETSNITDSQLNSVVNLTDETLYLLGSKALTAMISHESTKPLIMDKQYYDTQSQLMTLSQLKPKPEDLQTFSFIKQPDLPSSPVGKKKTLILILSILLGGIAGSAIVLVRNMVKARHLHR
ncbi:Wzz/FepE/Etk N-terminal domain-containing protein [Pantoea agglomerans]|uniref:LPS O-antigen chain length determinant protein WzzB n=1 Tax=Enterobacter agglomerans TaxID=549 RepID=A0ACC5RRN0_ENTAG|nr:Wzz/FepE/Etk N-terminal domain-containing protein [Pantoea agglomerans]MBK4727329.1 LPS O-antigen chain length determinant protein WzzB [Pantoea agglomerans]